MADPATLGYSLPDVSFNGARVRLTHLLGRGLSMVFAGRTTGKGKLPAQSVVVKWHPHANHLRSEEETLKHLNAVARTPNNALPPGCMLRTVIGMSDDKRALLLSPMLSGFAMTTADKNRALHDVLDGRLPTTLDQPVLLNCVHLERLVDLLAWLHTVPKYVHRDVKLPNLFTDPTQPNLVRGSSVAMCESD